MVSVCVCECVFESAWEESFLKNCCFVCSVDEVTKPVDCAMICTCSWANVVFTDIMCAAIA